MGQFGSLMICCIQTTKRMKLKTERDISYIDPVTVEYFQTNGTSCISVTLLTNRRTDGQTDGQINNREFNTSFAEVKIKCQLSMGHISASMAWMKFFKSNLARIFLSVSNCTMSRWLMTVQHTRTFLSIQLWEFRPVTHMKHVKYFTLVQPFAKKK